MSDVKPGSSPASDLATGEVQVKHDDAPAVSTQAAAAGPSPTPVPREELDRLVGGAHHNPHGILGAHPNPGGDGVTVRVLRPWARSVTVVTEDGKYPLQHEHRGIWAGVVPGSPGTPNAVPDYRLDVVYGEEGPHRVDDGYRFWPTVGEVDLHLIGEGRHEALWTVLGSHVRRFPSVMGESVGTAFAVWAPNAQGVRVIGDFNGWDGTATPMRSLGSAGVWEVFVPGIGQGTKYKYQILGRDGVWREKADPLARHTETPPATASVVWESDYEWTDRGWIEQREHTQLWKSPMSIYEVHLGSWRPGLTYRELAEQLVEYVAWLGYTHVEFLPVAEHPFGGSWGYQVSSYYAPTSRFGSPDDFRYLVDRLHGAGIGVIIDWVPAHFPKDDWSLGRFDGTALYEHPDPRRGEHPDWGTYVFDFGRNEVRNFLVANAVYWLGEFHIDGLRVDAVASMLYLDYSRKDGEWLPNQYGGRENLDAVRFLQEATATSYRHYLGTTIIAEESTAWPGVTQPTYAGGLGFGFKWNMGWMHDSLEYVSHEPIHKQYHHGEMTFAMVYAYSESYVLPISHDEVVHGKGSLLRKMPGDRWQQLANLRAFLAFMWAHPGKKLLFMGQEFGQEAEWSESRSLDWWLTDNPDHAGVQHLVRDMNRIYRETPALYELDNDYTGFRWVDANDAGGNTFSWLRFDSKGNPLACVVNFSPVPHEWFRLGLPHAGDWAEVLNSDADLYCGSGVGNMGRVTAEEVPWHGLPASAQLRIPPLGAVWLKPV